MTNSTVNITLLNAMINNDTETIISELEPLIFKNIRGVHSNIREDIYQELILTIINVINNFDYEQSGDLLDHISNYCEDINCNNCLYN